jgi:predicted ATPase
MRRGFELLRERNALLYDGLLKIALAEAEAGAGDIDRAVAVLDEALGTCEQTAHRAFEAELHRVRGEMLLKRDPANHAPAEEALQNAIAVAKQQGTRSFELRAALAFAKLCQSTARPAEAHDVLAQALEGFAPLPSPSGRRVGDEGSAPDDEGPQTLTPNPSPARERGEALAAEMPEIAEAQALLAALAETDEVKSAAASRQRRLQLQARYGQAMMHSRGYASDESKTAFARARTLAARAGDASERFDAYFGLLAGSLLRGELGLARETAESFLSAAETEGRVTEAAVARRNVGLARLYQGDLIGARANLAEVLRTYDPERDRDAKFRFGLDSAAGAAGYLALASWALGDVERARSLSDEALARADGTGHAPTRAIVHYIISRYHMVRGDSQAARRTATILTDLSREHGMALWLALGEVDLNWARAWLGRRERGMTGLREALAAYLGQGNKLIVPLFQGRLAELEAEGDDADGALRRIDEALALASETGERWTDALLHRIRGEILLKRDPANPAPAEEAFRAAIAIAQAQKARSFELRAALSLAKLYQSTARPADAHAVLAPALEGFAPLLSPSGRRAGDEGDRPDDAGLRTLAPDPSSVLRQAQHEGERGDALAAEMPEFAEAQALLAALEETEEVKADAAQREQRLHLQTAYGQALMWSKGFAADETKSAFGRAAEFAAKTDDFSQRFATAHGQWTLALTRSELSSARALASASLREAEDAGRLIEAGVARRGLALVSYFSGDFVQARMHCNRALEACNAERDQETRERYGEDTGTVAMSHLALTVWQLGEVDRARALIDAAIERAAELKHPPSMTHPLQQRAYLELLRGDAVAALSAADALASVSRERGMTFWTILAEIIAGWAHGKLFDPAAGADELRRALATYADQGARTSLPCFNALLAELEAETLGADSALKRVDYALALAHEIENPCELAFIHRLRGDILLKRDPKDPAPAEEAYRTAIAIAKQQSARSFELRAALSLAKLYQSTGRSADAQAVLAPALEGFSPTPEMPEIAESEALLAALAEADAAKALRL